MKKQIPPFKPTDRGPRAFTDVHVRLSSAEAEVLKNAGKPMAATLREAAMILATKKEEERFATRLDRLEKYLEKISKIESRLGDLYAQSKAIETDQITRETEFREALAESLKALSKSETIIKLTNLFCLALVHGAEDKGIQRSLARALAAMSRDDNKIQAAMLQEAMERGR
jgi:Asp-tRNA(Asn)/Glu-tRNA(Gln) amidotransferase C subunit